MNIGYTIEKHRFFAGFDDVFYAPHSRYTGVDHEAIAACDTLTVLADSDKVGELLLVSDDGKQIFVMGHLEYDRLTLDYEYKRDSKKGLNPDRPENYYPGDDSSPKTIASLERCFQCLVF